MYVQVSIGGVGAGEGDLLRTGIATLQFIPLAEETGLIIPIGQWILAEAIPKLLSARFEGRPAAELHPIA